MFIHKFKTDGNKTFYMVTESSNKPSGNVVNLGVEEWMGKASGGRVNNIAEYLKNLEFSKEETEEPSEEKKAVTELDSIASELESEAPFLALALDRISDQIESRVPYTHRVCRHPSR